MSRIKKAMPSPAMLVAIVALVAALGGSAIAEVASTSKLSKKEQKQTKKIAKKQANKQIDKKESGLDVNSAQTANSAGEADKLDGKDASELQTSSNYAERTTQLSLTSSFQPVVATSVLTSGTRILANATVMASADGGDNDGFICKLNIDGADGPSYSHDIADTTDAVSTAPVTFARTVSAGTHAIELACEASGGVSVDRAGLSVTAIGE